MADLGRVWSEFTACNSASYENIILHKNIYTDIIILITDNILLQSDSKGRGNNYVKVLPICLWSNLKIEARLSKNKCLSVILVLSIS